MNSYTNPCTLNLGLQFFCLCVCSRCYLYQDPGDTAIKTFRGCFNKMTVPCLFNRQTKPPAPRSLPGGWPRVFEAEGITHEQIREAGCSKAISMFVN